MGKRTRGSWILAVCVLLTACWKVDRNAIGLDPSAPLEAVKLLVTENGLYRVGLEDLQRLGFNVENPAELALTLRGEPAPVWSDSEGNLYFFGVPSNSTYTQANIYWLSKTGNPVESVEKISPVSLEDVRKLYPAQVTLEQNLVYTPLVEEGDHWFWERMPAPHRQTIEVELDEVDTGPGTIRVVVWGSTQSPGEQDHHLRVFVNDVLVIDEFWDGSGWKVLEHETWAGVFKEGNNLVYLDAPGDSGAAADVVWLDEIQITYMRQAKAINDRLEFQGEGAKLAISGLTEPVEVVDITDPTRPLRIDNNLNIGIDFRVPTEEGKQYFAAGKAGYLSPDLRVPAMTIILHEGLAGADYIAIGPQEFLAELTDLLAKRQSEGLATLALPLDEIYDQFNYGFPEPEAIHNFLTFAASNWQVKPQYVVLVGDATYDPQGYQTGPESNRLPTFFINTTFGGQTGSDLPYIDIDGDSKPDLAVGRVPAQTNDQVKIWVAKTLYYESVNGEAWQNKALAIADSQEESFQADAQNFLDQIAGGYEGQIFAPPTGSKEAVNQIQNYFLDGFGLIGYFGHGSLSMWGRDRLFSVEETESLHNENLPVVLTITCLNGYFIHPTTMSLAEALIWQPGGGAVAVLAPTSLTLATDQAVLGNALYQSLAARDGRLGDLVLAAQRAVPGDSRGQLEVRDTFLLFGDPALQLPGK